MDSIGYNIKAVHPTRDYHPLAGIDDLRNLDSVFSEFAAYVKNNPNVAIRISDFIESTKQEKWLKQNSLIIGTNIRKDVAELVYHLALHHYLIAENVQLVVHYLEDGLYDLLTTQHTSLRTILTNFFRFCDDEGIKPERKDFMRQYATVKRLHEANRNSRIKERLVKYQCGRNLQFENDIFTVIIPTTVEEFHDEAEAQHNCIERLYLEEVLEGNTNIVFIRRKDNLDQSYITCEVCNGKIKQYLTQFNQRPAEEDAIEFKRLYNQYLREIWGAN